GGCGGGTVFAGASGADALSGRGAQAAGFAGVLVKGDAWDPTDDAPAGAPGGPGTTPGAAHGPPQLCPGESPDWRAYALAAGRAYVFDSAGGTGDAHGELWADAGLTTLAGADDDGAGSLQFMIDATAASTARHYLRVRAVPAGGTWSGSIHARQVLAAAV